MIFYKLDKYRDHGLLILRIGIGIMFMFHGFPKLLGGPEVWTKLGGIISAGYQLYFHSYGIHGRNF